MTASILLSHLADLGVRLASEAGSLTVRAPKGVLTEDDRRAIAEHKPELLALVASVEPDPLDALVGPRRTPWGTLAWSDPDAPAIELFGPPAAIDVIGCEGAR